MSLSATVAPQIGYLSRISVVEFESIRRVLAMLLQHEIDHLDGILYVDRLPNKDMDLYPVENMPAIP